MRHNVSLEDVDKQELEKQIKGTLGLGQRAEVKYRKCRAVPQNDPASLNPLI